MSTTQELPQPVQESSRRERWRFPRWNGWSSRRRQIAAAVAVLVVIAVAATLLWARMSQPTAPVGAFALPERLDGLTVMKPDTDLTATTLWRSRAAEALPGGRVTGRTYGAGGPEKSIRIVTAKGDLTGKLELAWAADKGAAVGDDRCTQNVQLTPNGRAAVRPTLALCWRTSENLSAYVLLIDPKHQVTVAEAAKALDAAWPSSTTS